MKTIALLLSWYDSLRKSKWVNKYTVTFAVFFVWMLFFDKHNLIVQFRLAHTLNKLERQIENDQKLLDEALQEKYILETYAEKYAREKYFMHRADEDVFIIESE